MECYKFVYSLLKNNIKLNRREALLYNITTKIIILFAINSLPPFKHNKSAFMLEIM